MIFGLETQSPDSVREAVSEVLTELGVDSRCVRSAVKLNSKAPSSKPSPIIVRMSSAEVKWVVLRAARRLKNSRFARVFVKPDLTKSERDDQRVLCQHRDDLNKQNARPGQRCCIRNGDFVWRQVDVGRQREAERVLVTREQ